MLGKWPRCRASLLPQLLCFIKPTAETGAGGRDLRLLLVSCAKATKDPKYIEKYVCLWQYCWKHWVDHEHGGHPSAFRICFWIELD